MLLPTFVQDRPVCLWWKSRPAVKTRIAVVVQVLSYASEQDFSGCCLYFLILDGLAEAFNQQICDLKAPSKARAPLSIMTWLLKEAQCARELFIANKETMVSIASFYDDMDMCSQLSTVHF